MIEDLYANIKALEDEKSHGFRTELEKAKVFEVWRGDEAY